MKIRDMLGKTAEEVTRLRAQTAGNDDLYAALLASDSFVMAGKPHDILIGVWHDMEGTNVTFRDENGKEWDSYWPTWLQQGEDEDDEGT